MKKKIGFFLLCLLLALPVSLVFHTMKLSKDKQLNSINAGDLPRFTFQQASGDIFLRDSLQKNQATLIMRFSPSCGGCQRQFTELQAITVLPKMQLLLVSSSSWNELQETDEWLKKNTSWNYRIVQDKFSHFPEFFGTRALPSLLLYDQHWTLQKRFAGEMTATSLQPYFSGLLSNKVAVHHHVD